MFLISIFAFSFGYLQGRLHFELALSVASTLNPRAGSFSEHDVEKSYPKAYILSNLQKFKHLDWFFAFRRLRPHTKSRQM